MDEMSLEQKVENLLFVIWVQDQRFDYWRKVLRETLRELEEISKAMGLRDGIER